MKLTKNFCAWYVFDIVYVFKLMSRFPWVNYLIKLSVIRYFQRSWCIKEIISILYKIILSIVNVNNTYGIWFCKSRLSITWTVKKKPTLKVPAICWLKSILSINAQGAFNTHLGYCLSILMCFTNFCLDW